MGRIFRSGRAGGLFSGLPADRFCFEGFLWRRLGNGTMLVLTLAAAALVLACHWRPFVVPGTGWLRSFGRLSYEVYLTHMFVVWPVVRAFKATGARLWWGILWYVPAVAASWVLGWLVARYLSLPCERALRRGLDWRAQPVGVN